MSISTPPPPPSLLQTGIVNDRCTYHYTYNDITGKQSLPVPSALRIRDGISHSVNKIHKIQLIRTEYNIADVPPRGI